MSSRYASRASHEAELALREIQSRVEGNQYCADCGTTRPEYINLTIGTFICNLCADIHRTSSNRRIKDMYTGDVTMEDVRRMDSVGNDVANRKFLATWNPREVPEPDRRDKDSLREFLWLKYEGSFKQMSTPTPPSHHIPEGDRYYDSHHNDRSRERDTSYRREQQLFRDPQPPHDRSRNYWSSRLDVSRQAQQPPLPAPSRHDDYYRRGEGSGQPLPDRYRSTAPSDRFRPPQPAPLAPYDLARSARARYPDPYDDHASGRGYERDRRYATDLSSRYEGPEPAAYSDSELEPDRRPRKKKSSKGKRKSKVNSGNLDDDEYYYEDEEDEDVISERRSRKSQPSKSKKKSAKDSRKATKAKKRTEDEESDEETPSSSYDSEDEYERQVLEKKKSKRKGKTDKRREREVDSVKSLEDDTVPPTPVAQSAKGEFDLMSDWMGDSKDTEGSQGVPPAVTAGTPTPSAIPTAMRQAYQTAHMPMMPQVPLSMYNSVMPMPGGGFMPMMPPGFVPGMAMQGMPGMPPVMPAAMSGMPGTPGVAGANTSGIPGLVNGMHNVTLSPTPAGSGQGTVPPPPPIGVPAGPPPGPPPEPPQA